MPPFIPFYNSNRYQTLRDAGREETLRIAKTMGMEIIAELPALEGKFTVVDQKALPPPKPCTGVLPE